ncbi:ral guanine nucleotide dissociation stimulator-like [Canis lupus familiaris]|uniref:ral guanine nucleotide dissociation stimulator-like n=1 Tax=Canis lupus familiaris TaxID=9615 RepID=UPI0018F3B34F|nr:ral guanine nucleotide dissociation stimulator-like [Canis lupus familiaris]
MIPIYKDCECFDEYQFLPWRLKENVELGSQRDQRHQAGLLNQAEREKAGRRRQEAEQRKGLLHRFPRRLQEGQKRTWKEDTESCDYVRTTIVDSPPRTGVLDLLFTEYGYIVAACGDDDTVQRWKLAISCMLEIWLDYYGDDFCQLPEFPSLMKILQFVRQHMPGSDVELRARRNLQQFRRLHTVEPEAGASAQGKHPEAAQEQVPAETVGTAAPSGPAGIQAVPAAGAEGSARAEAPAGEVKPLQIVVTALVHCSALEEPPAPAATPEEEQAPAPAIGVPRVPEPPPASGTTGFDP